MADNKLLMLIAVAVVGFFILQNMGTQSQVPTATTLASSTPVVGTGCNQNPSILFSAVDGLDGTSAGTSPILAKYNGQAAQTEDTTLTPGVNEPVTVWVNNATNWFCEPLPLVGTCGNQNAQLKCYRNATTTVTAYDTDARLSPTQPFGAASTSNMTLAAGGTLNVELTYKITSKQPGLPLGGCLVLEYPTNISSATVSGTGIGGTCPYQITYSPATGNVYKAVEIQKGYDIDGLANSKIINVQFKSSSTGFSGEDAKEVKGLFYAANYYLTQDGGFALGIEQQENDESTIVTGIVANTSFGVK